MILLIDNYDSFVFNLARYFERLGQTTRVVRNDAIDAARRSRRSGRRPSCFRRVPARRTRRAARWMSCAQLAGARADSGRLPGTPGHRRGLGRPRRAARRTGARPHVADLSRRPRRVRRLAQSARRLPLSFAGRRARHAARRVWKSRPGPPTARSWPSAIDAVPVVGLQFHPESILTDLGLRPAGGFFAIGRHRRRRRNVPRSASETSRRFVAASLPGVPVTF